MFKIFFSSNGQKFRGAPQGLLVPRTLPGNGLCQKCFEVPGPHFHGRTGRDLSVQETAELFGGGPAVACRDQPDRLAGRDRLRDADGRGGLAAAVTPRPAPRFNRRGRGGR